MEKINYKKFTTIIYEPKFKSPFGDNRIYFPVADSRQQGLNGFNYIIVCCSPSWNYLFKYPKAKMKDYHHGVNGNRKITYIPADECEQVKAIDEINNPEIRKDIIELQKQWIAGQVRNNNYEYKKEPQWLLR